MKKLIVSLVLSLGLVFSLTMAVSAASWTSSEAFVIPSWGKMSKMSEKSKSKSGTISFGYMEALVDGSSFSKYGDFCSNNGSSRVTKTWYKLHVGNYTKMYYKTPSYSGTIRARACGETWEPSAGTIVHARFSAMQ